jgi:hypothetical protein
MTAAHVAAQNVQFGRTNDRHADDRVAAPIGGYARDLLLGNGCALRSKCQRKRGLAHRG